MRSGAATSPPRTCPSVASCPSAATCTDSAPTPPATAPSCFPTPSTFPGASRGPCRRRAPAWRAQRGTCATRTAARARHATSTGQRTPQSTVSLGTLGTVGAHPSREPPLMSKPLGVPRRTHPMLSLLPATAPKATVTVSVVGRGSTAPDLTCAPHVSDGALPFPSVHRRATSAGLRRVSYRTANTRDTSSDARALFIL